MVFPRRRLLCIGHIEVVHETSLQAFSFKKIGRKEKPWARGRGLCRIGQWDCFGNLPFSIMHLV